MKKISYKLIYNRKNKLNKQGKSLIQIECYLAGKRKYLSTGIYIKPEEWNEKQKKIKSNNPDYWKLNSLLNKELLRIEQFELDKMSKNGSCSLAELGNVNKSTDNDFFEFALNFIENTNSLKKATKTQHRTIVKRLQRFCGKLQFKDINYKLVVDYDNYLREQNLHINTIWTQHRVFKTYINKAIKSELFPLEKNPYLKFKLKKVPSKRIDLTMNEVEKIAKLKFTDEYRNIEKTRDMFIFSCYTGLRFGDMQNLKNTDIIMQKGKCYADIRQNKTDELLTIPLSELFNGKPFEIIKKYQSDNEFVFPRISNKEANIHLKIIAFLTKITNKKLSYHISRHTFGTNAVYATKDIYLIKELMGHSDIRTSSLYLHSSKERLSDSLQNTNWGD